MAYQPDHVLHGRVPEPALISCLFGNFRGTLAKVSRDIGPFGCRERAFSYLPADACSALTDAMQYSRQAFPHHLSSMGRPGDVFKQMKVVQFEIKRESSILREKV